MPQPSSSPTSSPPSASGSGEPWWAGLIRAAEPAPIRRVLWPPPATPGPPLVPLADFARRFEAAVRAGRIVVVSPAAAGRVYRPAAGFSPELRPGIRVRVQGAGPGARVWEGTVRALLVTELLAVQEDGWPWCWLVEPRNAAVIADAPHLVRAD